MLDFKSRGKHLVEGPHGILTTPFHQDVEFAYADTTNWMDIEESSFWYQHRNRCFLALTERFKPKGPLFEIGSGNGNVALALQSAGFDVVAVEPTVRSAIASRKRGVHQVVCAKIGEAGFAYGDVANIGLFDVLEHIEDDAGFIASLRRLMPVGGYFYCAVPAWNFLWSREDEAAGHCRRYRGNQLESLFSGAGFRIEYSSYFFAPLVLPILFLRALPSALGLRDVRTDRQSRQEHTLPRSWSGNYLRRQLERESARIAQGQRIRIGASCLLVARAC